MRILFLIVSIDFARSALNNATLNVRAAGETSSRQGPWGKISLFTRLFRTWAVQLKLGWAIIKNNVNEEERVHLALAEFTSRTNFLRFQICSKTLERAYVSIECNSRFCLGCISNADEKTQFQCQCSWCIATDQATKIVEDNQYGQLVSLFSGSITLLV